MSRIPNQLNADFISILRAVRVRAAKADEENNQRGKKKTTKPHNQMLMNPITGLFRFFETYKK